MAGSVRSGVWLSLGVLLGVLVSWRPAAAHQAEIVPASWDLGTVEEGQVAHLTIRMLAPGGGALRLTRVRPACECLTGEILQTDGAGGPALLRLRFEAVGLSPGAHEDCVYLHWVAEREEHVERYLVRYRVLGSVPGGPPTSATLFFSRDAPDAPEVLSRTEDVRRETCIDLQVLVMENLENYRNLRQMERTAGVTDLADIELFVEGACFGTKGPVLRKLDELIAAWSECLPQAASGGSTPAAANGALRLRLFGTPGCPTCRAVRREVLAPLSARFGKDLVVEEFNLRRREDYEELIRVERVAGVLARGAATVEVGEGYLYSGVQEIRDAVPRKVEDILSDQAPARNPSVLAAADGGGHADASAGVVERFRSFSLASVALAGLVDGLNPCAFVTAVFLISLLKLAGTSGWRLWGVGFVFVAVTYATYFALGVGLYAVVDRLSSVDWIQPLLVRGTAGLAVVLAGLSLRDLVVYRRTGRAEDVVLQLPSVVKKQMHSVMRRRFRFGLTLAGTAIGAFLVTALEAACTGQVYLPTLVLVAQEPTLRARAWGCLALYDAAFVVPLVIVFFLAWAGMTSRRLEEISRRNVVLAKGAAALFFLGLAGVLILLQP